VYKSFVQGDRNMDLEWTPPEKSPRRLPQKEAQSNDVLTNPIIASGLLSIATGKNVQPPVTGKAGRDYMNTIISQGHTPPSFDF